MPIYEYVCTGCGKKHEEMQKISDKPLRKCPKCGALKLKKALSLSGFHLKGGGWYKDGYSSASAKSEASSEAKPKSEKKSETKSESKKEAKSST